MIGRMIVNGTLAAGRVAAAVTTRRQIFVGPLVQMVRETICESCEFNVSGRCQKCGCSTCGEILNKTRMATEECPMGYWKTCVA